MNKTTMDKPLVPRPDTMKPGQRDIQLTESGDLKHFLTTEGLSRDKLTNILDTAETFTSVNEKVAKKVPLLRGKIPKAKLCSTRYVICKPCSVICLSLDMLHQVLHTLLQAMLSRISV